MAARVGGYPGGYVERFVEPYNTDPGVYEPECDWEEEQQPAYPDTQQFLDQIQEQQQQQPQVPIPPPATPGAELPLAGDYKGLGGPQTVPLYTPSAFEKPAPPQVSSLLGEIFMEPTTEQLEAYYRVLAKGRVVQTKYRLKCCIFIHYVMVFCMITKLLPEILDIVDIFVLEIEELFVPKPMLWEWLWLLSVPVTFFGLSACKKSSLIAIRRFMIGSILFSLLPVLVGMGMHAADCYTFLFEEEEQERDTILMWQGYPYSVLWYAFFFVALQVHCYQLYFANCLMRAWMPAPALKKAQ